MDKFPVVETPLILVKTTSFKLPTILILFAVSDAGNHLIASKESLEELFLRVDEISSMQIRGAVRIQNLISEYKSSIELSRKLTGIVCDIDDVSVDEFEIKSTNPEALMHLCNQFNLSGEAMNKWKKLHSTLSSFTISL